MGNYNEKEMKVIGDEHNEEVKLRYSAIARTTKNKIEEDIEKNRQILKVRFSEKTILNKTENLIKKVISS